MSSVMFEIGPFEIKWYSVLVLTGFIIGYFIVMQRCKKEDISLSFENKNLIVKATYKVLNDEKVKYLHLERKSGTYSRSYYIGDIKHDKIKASFENGLLTIIIPKESYMEVEKSKSIEIN